MDQQPKDQLNLDLSQVVTNSQQRLKRVIADQSLVSNISKPFNSARDYKKSFDKEFQLDFFKLTDKELHNVTKILVKNISSHMVTNNKKRLKSLQQKAQAEQQKSRDPHQIKTPEIETESSARRTFIEKVDFNQIPITQRWKNQSYQTFKLPINQFIEREKTKKEKSKQNTPQEVMNYIETCMKEKEKTQSLISKYKQSYPMSLLYDQPPPMHQIFPDQVAKRFQQTLNGGIVASKKAFFQKQLEQQSLDDSLISVEPDLNSKIDKSIDRMYKQSKDISRSYQTLPNLSRSRADITQSQKIQQKYKDYFDNHKADHGMPNTGETELKKKLGEKTDKLIDIIRNCDDFKEAFIDEQKQLKRSIEREQGSLHDRHEDLLKQAKGKRLLLMQPQNKVITQMNLPQIV
ncbi:UNKNOWN [Stylonychia lemnae]|uniref:Uncharacterized protein n=1 Tax=Stylonychia lemnae TaxID=5949 RepID=A0A078APU0_STYLE|nr:UNKNOWN [Stylonychia lemnae]|eukprot:CDW83986.1 UNKNOWN [Stylonychia lemnae]